MTQNSRQTADAIKDALHILIETSLAKDGLGQAHCMLAAFVEVSAELGLSCLGKDTTLRVFREATQQIKHHRAPPPKNTH